MVNLGNFIKDSEDCSFEYHAQMKMISMILKITQTLVLILKKSSKKSSF